VGAPLQKKEVTSVKKSKNETENTVYPTKPVNKLPLMIFEDGRLSYANFSTEKIFDCYFFTLSTSDINDLFHKTTLKELSELPQNASKETDVYTANGSCYRAVVNRAALDDREILYISFLRPVTEIKRIPQNVKTSSADLLRQLLNHSKRIIDDILKELKTEANAYLIEKLWVKINNLFQNIIDFFDDIITDKKASFEVFDLCGAINGAVLSTGGGENVNFVSAVNNGYVFGNKKKFTMLIKQFVKDLSNKVVDINLMERVDKAVISISTLRDANSEFSEEFIAYAQYGDIIKKEMACEAGCLLQCYFSPGQGQKIVITYDVAKAYRFFGNSSEKADISGDFL
jgi:hypothetical protein